MKRKLLILLVILSTLFLSADLGFSVQAAVKDFHQIVVVNTETGCTADYYASADKWRVVDAGGELVFAGSEGAAMNALLFTCD